MNTLFPYQIGPSETPPLVRLIIIATAVLSLTTAVIDPLLEYLFGMQGLAYLFGLSRDGLSHFLIWQPITHLLIQPLSSMGISFGFLIGLAFNLYIIWVIGTLISERIGTHRFGAFYLGVGAAAQVKKE